MTDSLPARRDQAAIIEQVVIKGDLSKLSEAERVSYYMQVCASAGLNPVTQPFQYLQLSGKLTLYATRACTDQLRANRKITANVVSRERIDDVYVVTARVTEPSGRADESIGAVSIGGLKGDALANALMKAETKAKRRATLSLTGLGLLDETEIETIPGAQTVNAQTGEMAERPAITALPTPIAITTTAEQPPMPLGDVATPQQVRAIYSLARNTHGWAEPVTRERCLARWDCEPNQLTRQQASIWITELQAESK